MRRLDLSTWQGVLLALIGVALIRSSPTASDNPLILQRVDVEVGRAVLATR
jgi:hypothetical protein